MNSSKFVRPNCVCKNPDMSETTIRRGKYLDDTGKDKQNQRILFSGIWDRVDHQVNTNARITGKKKKDIRTSKHII